MRAVEKNGEVVIREAPRAARIRMAARNAVRHLAETTVTKADLMRTYEMTHREATELVHLMMSEGTMADRGRGFTWENQYEVKAPPAPAAQGFVRPRESAAEKAHRLRMEKLFSRYGRGVCVRCGGVMPGTSQRAKSKRGHTRDVCDLAMVRVIQDS